MEHRNTNIDDLGGEKLSHSLGVNPFGVPANFFEQQQEEILNQIQLEKRELAEPSSTQSIPENYFQGLESNILNRISEIKLKEVVSSQNDGFAVPEDYFNNANKQILNIVKEEKLKETVTDAGFGVPDGYFTSLTDSIALKISEQKIKNLVEKDGFMVPKSYFEDLEDNIVNKTNEESTNNDTPIIPLSKKRNIWTRYSAAAAVLLIGVGTYFTLTDNNTSDSNEIVSTTVELQKISDAELVNYLAQVSNTDELMQLSTIIHETSDMSTKQIETDIKNEDIEEYLNYML